MFLIFFSRKHDYQENSNENQMKLPTPEKKLSVYLKKDPNTMPDSMLCKICYKEEMSVAFIPCGHVIACVQCAMTLDLCAVCRQPFNMAMKVNIHLDETKDEDEDDQLPCSSSQCSDEPLDPMLCKVCHKEEMEAAFIPCRHVYACVKCAADMHECPICSVAFCATIQVYL